MSTITPLTRKVLVIDFRPAAVPAHWNHSATLIPQYIDAMQKASNNLLTYQVADTLTVAEYPVLMGGQQYDDTFYPRVVKDDKLALRDARGNYLLADYQAIIQRFDLVNKIEHGLIDEVWMFGGPYFGFYESRMVGRGAFWCNGPGMEVNCRRFVIMGFNYERSVKEMIHDYGHRSESILGKHFGSESFVRKLYDLQPTPAPANAYEQFLLVKGTVHRKPGGEEYGQDEYAWLVGMLPEWWPPTIDPNLVPERPVPWFQTILNLFMRLFEKK